MTGTVGLLSFLIATRVAVLTRNKVLPLPLREGAGGRGAYIR